MTTGITLQAQAPASAGADLGFWLASQIIGQPMAMTAQHLSHVVETISANRFSLPRNRKTGARITDKGTAIVEIHGMLIDRAPVLGTFWGLTAYEGLEEQFRRLETHDEVSRIVLDIDSPGGLVRGIDGCAEALARLAKKKPVHAIAHNMACSAAYWLGAMAKSLSIAPGAEVGSIGVRAGHVSYAEQLDRAGIKVTMFGAGATKNDGSPYALLSDGEFAERNYDIARTNDRFVAHVARHRPLTEQDVRDFDARCFSGAAAIEAKLADRIEGLDALIERLEAGAAKTRPKRKSSVEKGSKAGILPLEREPDEPDDDDDAPVQGITNRKGSKLMTVTADNDGAADIADQITTALAAIYKGNSSAPAAAADRQVASPAAGMISKADADRLAVDAATAAVLADRERAMAILSAPEAKGREALAIRLAFKSAMTLDDAKETLAAAGQAPAGAAAASGFALLTAAMGKSGNSAGIKPDAAAAAEGASSFAAGMPSLADKIAAQSKATATRNRSR